VQLCLWKSEIGEHGSYLAEQGSLSALMHNLKVSLGGKCSSSASVGHVGSVLTRLVLMSNSSRMAGN